MHSAALEKRVGNQVTDRPNYCAMQHSRTPCMDVVIQGMHSLQAAWHWACVLHTNVAGLWPCGPKAVSNPRTGSHDIQTHTGVSGRPLGQR
jgi:hypothetical protein